MIPNTRHARTLHGNGCARSLRGFSLVETLIAVALASSLVLALAASAHVFASEHEFVGSVHDTRLERTLAEVSDHVSQAWMINLPSAETLEITDAAGGRTAYFLAEGAFKVTRPSGATGTLIEDVKSVAFEVQHVSRLRERAPLESQGDWWSKALSSAPSSALLSFGEAIVAPTAKKVSKKSPAAPAPEPAGEPLGVLENDEALALGFTVSADAPESVNTVPGVEEEVLTVTLDRLVLPIAYGNYVPLEVPAATKKAKKASTGKKAKTTLCHLLPGTPNTTQTIVVGGKAVAAHLAHGDSTGPCAIPATAPAYLSIELYEARVINDPRPFGPLLGAINFPAASLPLASYTIVGGVPTVVMKKKGGISVKKSSASPITGLMINPPTLSVPIDLSSFGVEIKPGLAYTIVVRFTGDGFAVLRSAETGSAVLSTVARSDREGAAFQPQALEVQLTLDGLRAYSQTDSHEVISRVTVTLELIDGRKLTVTAAVEGQISTPNSWLGVVPGEVPALEMYGQ